MRTATRALAFGLMSLLCLGDVAPVRAQSPETKVVSDTVTSADALEIENRTGSITVHPWDRDAIGYEVRIEPTGASEDSPLTTLSTTRAENRLTLAPDFPWRFQIPGLITIAPGGSKRPALHYTVTVPPSVQLHIDNYASSVDISGMEGPVTVDTYSGDVQIEVAALKNPISVDTYSGPVRLLLPAEAGFNLDASVPSSNQIRVSDAFSLSSSSPDADEKPVNGGGPRIAIDSYKGPVELLPR